MKLRNKIREEQMSQINKNGIKNILNKAIQISKEKVFK